MFFAIGFYAGGSVAIALLVTLAYREDRTFWDFGQWTTVVASVTLWPVVLPIWAIRRGM